MALALTCRNISKVFPGNVMALTGIDLEIAAGQVFGLIGRNGVGKTTLMKIIVGLIRSTSGSMKIFGQEDGANSVGSLIEAPAFYPHLTGIKNLQLLAKYIGVNLSEVIRVMELVGMADRAGYKFREYSAGMKQRLGVAAALLGDPQLILLDEPINGLDPQAIVSMRALLTSLKEDGHTILLSSHLLTEVEQICDQVAIIEKGSILFQGTPTAIKNMAVGTALVNVTVSEAQTAASFLARQVGIRKIRTDSATEITVELDQVSSAQLNRMLVGAGIDVYEISRDRSLESAYLEMTNIRLHDSLSIQGV